MEDKDAPNLAISALYDQLNAVISFSNEKDLALYELIKSVWHEKISQDEHIISIYRCLLLTSFQVTSHDLF